MRRLALFSLLCSLAACDRDLGITKEPGATDPSRTTVNGIVQIERPGSPEPVEAVGTTIDVLLPDGTTRTSAVAGEGGRFAVVTGAPPFTLHFQYDSTGDGVADRMLLLSSRELPIIDGTDFSLGALLLGRSVEVHGAVRRGDLPDLDVGHDGIQVEAIALPVAPVTTNSRGEFVLRGLPAGSFELRLAATGYRDERIGVEAFPGQSVKLSDVTLSALEVTPPGGIVGTVVRNDALPGDAIVEVISVADSRSVARSFATLGAAFEPIEVPPGRYFVRAETGGFPSERSQEFDLASGDLFDVGTLLVRVSDEPLVRDGAIAAWEPSSQQLLPSLGPITASFGSRLRERVIPSRPPLSPFALLQVVDAAGAVVEGTQHLEELEDPSLPGGVRTLVSFYPERPLPPGRYVATVLPTVVDEADQIPPAGPTSWISLGVGVTPGPTATPFEGLYDGSSAELPIELQDFPDGSARVQFAFEDPFYPDMIQWQSCRIVRGEPITCADRAGIPTTAFGLWPTPTLPEAALFRDLGGFADSCGTLPQDRDLGELSGFDLSDPTAARLTPVDATGARYCSSAFTPRSEAATDYLATVLTGGRLPTTALHAVTLGVDPDGSAGALTLDPTPLVSDLPFIPTGLDVVPIGEARWVALHDEPSTALPSASLLLAPLPFGGALAEVPALPVAFPDAIQQPTALCALDGQALALMPLSAWDPVTQAPAFSAQLQSFRWDAAAAAWNVAPNLPFPPSATFVFDVACVAVGRVAFVTAIVDGRLFAFWYDGVRWEPIFDRSTPDGALTRSGCDSSSVALLAVPDGALVAHRQNCSFEVGSSLRLAWLR